jgi:hypothetical protein
MIPFLIVLGGLVGLTAIIQVARNMKIVGGNELGVVSGTTAARGFRTLSGGRAFVVPLLQRFAKLDLTPITIEVHVDSSIAAGIVPLNVKATVSFAIASNEMGRNHAVTRILSLASSRENLMKVASDIIEGHLRDSIASMTPEQVMKDKDILVAKMINVCKNDLENIGLEITTMNIADVDDHRLPGVTEPDLYIALLKRVQSVAAETRARQAQAEAKAASAEQSEARRAETEVNALSNELERLKADTKVALKQAGQKAAVGNEQETRNAQASVGGVLAEIEAEKRKIEALKSRYEAEIVTPALAQREKLILNAKADAALMLGTAHAEMDQLEVTMKILSEAGPEARRAYLIENFQRLFMPFAETLSFYPARRVTVMTGVGGGRQPLSAIHPDAVAMARNEMIAGALAQIVQSVGEQPAKSAAAPPAPETPRAAPTQPAQAQTAQAAATSSQQPPTSSQGAAAQPGPVKSGQPGSGAKPAPKPRPASPP